MDAEEIVRALAAIEDPTVADRDYGAAGECGLCWASDNVPGDMYGHELDDPQKHEPTCPWRLAREWVAEREGPENPVDVIEADHDLQSVADLFDVPREVMGDAEREARVRRLRREADEAEGE